MRIERTIAGSLTPTPILNLADVRARLILASIREGDL